MAGAANGTVVARAAGESAIAPVASRYRRREPERTLSHATVRAHWKTFLAEVEDGNGGGASLPRFVVGEFERYLAYGILAHGLGCRDAQMRLGGTFTFAMPKLLVEQDWYEPLQPNSVLDTAYETMLLDRAAKLFPGFLPVQVHQRISDEGGHSFAHLALVDHKYRAWWLALLETGPAPSAKYVLDQAAILRGHRYGRDFALMLVVRNKDLDARSLEGLFSREMPNVFVLLAHPPPPRVHDAHIRVGIAEIFQSSTGSRILRINGEHPNSPADLVGTCRRDPLVAQLLKLTLKENESVPPNPCDIEVEGAVSAWTIRQRKDVIWLVAQGSVVLPVGTQEFFLVKSASGRLQLLPSEN
jgi:hypothetical protein